MNACEEHYDCIVVYAGKDCPACAMDETIGDLKSRLVSTKEGRDTLDDEKTDLERRVAELERQVAELEARLEI